jgi:SagB-type dehydrogenase family enzyme
MKENKKNVEKMLGKKGYKAILFLLIAFLGCNRTSGNERSADVLTETKNSPLAYVLPSPSNQSAVSVEEALTKRRSQRRFQSSPLSAEQLSQILWSAYGLTDGRGLRTTPSAGALYPLEIYVVVGNVVGMEAGVYKYLPHEHKIIRTLGGDLRDALNAATFGQRMVNAAPVTVVYTAVYSRITERYGERGRQRYVYMEIGHSSQNVYLQAEALGLGTCAIGAFADDRVSAVLGLPREEAPLYLMPVGYFYQ